MAPLPTPFFTVGPGEKICGPYSCSPAPLPLPSPCRLVRTRPKWRVSVGAGSPQRDFSRQPGSSLHNHVCPKHSGLSPQCLPRESSLSPGAASSSAREFGGAVSRACGSETATEHGLGRPETVGVIVVDHGSRRSESNANLDEFVQVFSSETGYRIVEPAHMELARPSISDAFAKCAKKGVTDIIVCPYFLAPGRHWSKDIPALCAEAAEAYPGTRYIVTAPIGAHPLVARVLEERIKHCLRRTQCGGEACAACEGNVSTVGCLP